MLVNTSEDTKGWNVCDNIRTENRLAWVRWKGLIWLER